MKLPGNTKRFKRLYTCHESKTGVQFTIQAATTLYLKS